MIRIQSVVLKTVEYCLAIGWYVFLTDTATTRRSPEEAEKG